MPVEDPPGLSFRQAKDAFFAALLNRRLSLSARAAGVPSRCHVARTVQTEIGNLISSLEDLEDDLNDIQREIKQAQNSVLQLKSAALMSLQPIGMLPPEIIRKIVVHTVDGPCDHRRILRLSQVSKLWRETVLGISALFTTADWESWPAQLVDTWCLRAGRHLLKIYVGDSLVTRMDCGSRYPYRALLERFSTQVGELEVSCYKTSPAEIFDFQMPSLQTLYIANDDGVCIELQNLPILRVLTLASGGLGIPTPLTSVTHFHYHASLLMPPTHLISQLPCLQHLAITVAYPCGPGGGSERRIVLPSLISLEIQWISPPHASTVQVLLGVYSFPKLQTIVLHNHYNNAEIQTIIRSLGVQVPHLRTFYFLVRRGESSWTTLLSVLTPDTSTAAVIFPELQEVTFSYIGNDKLECNNEHYELLRDFLLPRKGTLTRLAIPRMENMDILDPLNDHISHFEVSECRQFPLFF